MLDDGGADDGDCFFLHGRKCVFSATVWLPLLLLPPLLLLLYPENHDKCYYDGPSFGYGDDRRPSTIVDRLR